MNNYDLNNLSKDPAQEANSRSRKVENEEKSPNLGQLRHLRALHQSRAFRDQSRKLLTQQNATPDKTESRSSDKQNTSA